MFKTLSTRLAASQAILFFVLGVGFIVATERMFEGGRLLELATDLGIGVVVFSLFAALLVFNFLTRRLRALAVAVDRFRDSGFTEPIRLASANSNGDDIDRLGANVQEMSERIAEQLRSARANRRAAARTARQRVARSAHAARIDAGLSRDPAVDGTGRCDPRRSAATSRWRPSTASAWAS